MAVMADRAVELHGGEPYEAPAGDTRVARAAELAHDLVEAARSNALQKLGEGRQAIAIATNWVRWKLLASATRGL